MSELNPTVLEQWTPPAVKQLFNQTIDRLRFLKYPDKSLLARNACLKNTGKGKRAFLLTTGPSVKLENLNLLEGEDCFSVSNFFVHEDINTIQPKFHFFAPYHKPLVLENYVDWLKLSDQTLPKSTAMVLGHSGKELVEQYGLFKEREVYYLYLTGTASTAIDLTQPVLYPRTGPIMILPVLFYMGYSEIYLLGCDGTWLRDYNSFGIGKDKGKISNFYKPEQDIRKNVRAKKDIVFQAGGLYRIMLQYKYYADLAEQSEDCQIFNLSQDTWLDMYPSQLLADVINA